MICWDVCRQCRSTTQKDTVSQAACPPVSFCHLRAPSVAAGRSSLSVLHPAVRHVQLRQAQVQDSQWSQTLHFLLRLLRPQLSVKPKTQMATYSIFLTRNYVDNISYG